MYFLPMAFSNSGIIGVSVGPGFTQLMRMPCAASGNDRNAVYALIASFERPYAFASSFGCSSHHARAAAKSGVASSSNEQLHVLHPADAGGRRDARDRAQPSIISGITASVSWRSPQKFTSITSRSGNVFGSPAQLKSMLTILPILATVVVDLRGIAQIALAEAREPGHLGLLDVDRVHLGTELDEDLRGRRAHPRRRTGDDARACPRTAARRFTRLSPPTVIARSGQFSAPTRACSASAPSDVGDEDLAVAEVVGREHVGREHVAAAVADTQIGIDAHLHGRQARRRYAAPTDDPCVASCACGHSCSCSSVSSQSSCSSGSALDARRRTTPRPHPVTPSPDTASTTRCGSTRCRCSGRTTATTAARTRRCSPRCCKSTPGDSRRRSTTRTRRCRSSSRPRRAPDRARRVVRSARAASTRNPSFPIAQGVQDPRQPGDARARATRSSTRPTSTRTRRASRSWSCLQLVKTWSNAHPGHVPIEIQIEMKDDTRSPSRCSTSSSRRSSRCSTRDEIITPDDVRGNCRDARRGGARARLADARRRCAARCTSRSTTRASATTYLAGHPSLRGRLLFTPSSPGQDDAAFAKLNDPIADAAKIKAALAAHMIVRTRADADTVQARANDTTHAATRR